jgi:hypothetical protein
MRFRGAFTETACLAPSFSDRLLTFCSHRTRAGIAKHARTQNRRLRNAHAPTYPCAVMVRKLCCMPLRIVCGSPREDVVERCRASLHSVRRVRAENPVEHRRI